MDLFSFSQEYRQNMPLAERLRPETLDEFIGQAHIVGQGTLLRRAISADRLGSCVFFGPPGTGKTTLANIIAKATNGHFEKLNAVSSGVAEAKKLIEDAKNRKKMYNTRTYLLLDECHRWNKAQSDCVLGAIESGDIIFIGSTTENPFVSMTKAILSRCRIFEFKKLSEKDIADGLEYALKSEKGLAKYRAEASVGVLKHIAWASDGDLRTALNALELAVLTTPVTADGRIIIDVEIAEQSIQKQSLSVDESLYYDILSAFCKSLRGSDSDAALYWSERLIQAGCDPMVIARRLIVHSAEDVGMADPQALIIAVSAMTAMQNIGLPEGRIPLAEAIIYVAEASKSNSVVNALQTASYAATETKDDNVPLALRDTNYKQEQVKGYKYPHDFGGYIEQQYLPDSLKNKKFYIQSNNGYEKTLTRSKVIMKNKG
ncbi:MAG: replication-associated recombination protein A [Clostridia bacterium]|nr:replication-associated recombination protein A [Clostridia bacterium]